MECNSLSSIIIPYGVTTIRYDTFYNCHTLSNVIIPDSVTTIETRAFYTCINLRSIVIPDDVTYIGQQAFENCNSLSHIAIPQGVTEIKASTFSNCFGMAYYDFSNHIAVPTLANVNAFTGIPSDCKIIVPDELYEDWIIATNWSDYASNIIKVSDI